MLKKHMAACLVVTAFAAAPAFAQTSPAAPSGGTDRPAASGSGSPTMGSPAMQPSSPGSSTSGSSAMNQSGAQGQFMTKIQPEQIMASKLIGTRVVSANNESIGDINDVIVDRNGQAVAAVVGVGGFLGIGEKDVAVPFNSLEFMNAQQASAMSGNTANAPATTGSTATTGTTTGTTAGTGTSASASSSEPERVVLRMTKAELQAAPAFDDDSDDDNANQSGTSGTSAPANRPATPTTPQQ